MENPAVRQNYLKMLMVWSTLLSSQVLFFFIVIYNKPGIFPPDMTRAFAESEGELLMAGLFAMLGVSNLFISAFIKRKGTNTALDQRNVDPMQTALVVGCALCETTSVFGMILAFAFDNPYFFAWFIAGFLGILYHFPNKANVRFATLKG